MDEPSPDNLFLSALLFMFLFFLQTFYRNTF